MAPDPVSVLLRCSVYLAAEGGENTGDYMAHGYCFAWERPLVALHVTSDLITGLAYFTISAALLYFAYRRRDLPFRWIFGLFGLFIVACGTTHLLAAYTVYRPDYWMEGVVKAFTAVVSVAAAIGFIPLIPEAIALPSLKARVKETERLNEELRRADRTLQQVQDFVLLVDAEGRVLRANESAAVALGYGPQAMEGAPFLAIDAAGGWEARWDRLGSEGGARWETLFRGRDGREIEVEVSASLIEHPDAPCACVVARDISGRKADERLLEAETLKLRTLIDTLPDLVWLKDLDGAYLFCNPRCASFMGAPEAEILGKTDYDFASAADAELFRAQDRVALEKGEPCLNEEWVTSATDGHRELLETVKVPMKGPAGRIIGVLGLARDVTGKRQNQEQLRTLSKVIEQSPVGVLITDPSGAIEYVNPRMEEQSGYSLEDLRGKNPRLLNAGTTRPEVYRELWGTIQTGQVWRGEIQNRRRNGESYPASLSISPILDEQGEITHFVALQEDLSDRLRVTEQLRETEAQYRRLFQNMLNGMALCRMIWDEEGRPVDFTYLAVNRAFERLTGLQGVEGRRVTEVIPGILESNPELFELYARVARTMEPERLETLVPALGIWFSISAYSPKLGEFVAIFDVITERKRAEEALRVQLEELQRWQEATLGREGRILDLKREVNALLQDQGKPPRYASPEQER